MISKWEVVKVRYYDNGWSDWMDLQEFDIDIVDFIEWCKMYDVDYEVI